MLAVVGLICLLGLFRIMIFLEVLLGHLPLNYHKTRVDEGFFEKLTLEHSYKIFNANVFA